MIKIPENIKKRLRNPLFIMAVAGITYQILQKTGVAIPDELFRSIVDIISYAAIGTGVYSTFDKTTKVDNE